MASSSSRPPPTVPSTASANPAIQAQASRGTEPRLLCTRTSTASASASCTKSWGSHFTIGYLLLQSTTGAGHNLPHSTSATHRPETHHAPYFASAPPHGVLATGHRRRLVAGPGGLLEPTARARTRRQCTRGAARGCRPAAAARARPPFASSHAARLPARCSRPPLFAQHAAHLCGQAAALALRRGCAAGGH